MQYLRDLRGSGRSRDLHVELPDLALTALRAQITLELLNPLWKGFCGAKK